MEKKKKKECKYNHENKKKFNVFHTNVLQNKCFNSRFKNQLKSIGRFFFFFYLFNCSKLGGKVNAWKIIVIDSREIQYDVIAE